MHMHMLMHMTYACMHICVLMHVSNAMPCVFLPPSPALVLVLSHTALGAPRLPWLVNLLRAGAPWNKLQCWACCWGAMAGRPGSACKSPLHGVSCSVCERFPFNSPMQLLSELPDFGNGLPASSCQLLMVRRNGEQQHQDVQAGHLGGQLLNRGSVRPGPPLLRIGKAILLQGCERSGRAPSFPLTGVCWHMPTLAMLEDLASTPFACGHMGSMP